MKSPLALVVVVATAASLASAGIVITPIFSDQVVDKSSGDCFFGVVTPQGCGCVALYPSLPFSLSPLSRALTLSATTAMCRALS
ncbi:hypothetical protein O9K51_02355 [Purpureocillium lavendulum]|uniref:Uncharacterized protein n=1 Tax=Purpureocillium lavendulum TaxID=1247861 RepID=A0AB34FXX0_9HYPO|nr:hypothetical protein O9K51_02355 [Purpureocillium lavendulum]